MNESEEIYPPNETEEPVAESAINIEETAPPATASEKQARTLLRNILRWTLTLLIIFGLGFITSYILFFMPSQKELEQTSAELSQTYQENNTLENQIAELNQTNQDLEHELDSAELRLMMLSAISDVRAANLAVADDDYAGALLSIIDASQTLGELNDVLSEDQSEIIVTMQEELAVIEDALISNPESAYSGLERLVSNLLRLERAILK